MMSFLLSRRGAEVVAEIARMRTLLAFDFDGTLAPIVADRDAAALGDVGPRPPRDHRARVEERGRPEQRA